MCLMHPPQRGGGIMFFMFVLRVKDKEEDPRVPELLPLFFPADLEV